MMNRVDLVVEDRVSEAVARRILLSKNIPIGTARGFHGKGYIDSKHSSYYNASRNVPYQHYLVIRDLDTSDCVKKLLARISPGRSKKFIFRVAIKEIETWLIADSDNFAEYLGVHKSRLQIDPESIEDPKRFIVNLAAGSRKREIRRALRSDGSGGISYGSGFNSTMIEFVQAKWDFDSAASKSESLFRALAAIDELKASWS